MKAVKDLHELGIRYDQHPIDSAFHRLYNDSHCYVGRQYFGLTLTGTAHRQRSTYNSVLGKVSTNCSWKDTGDPHRCFK